MKEKGHITHEEYMELKKGIERRSVLYLKPKTRKCPNCGIEQFADKEYCSDFEDKTQPKKPSLWWKCERCGKLIPYMADFCYECADELLGEPPKPFEPQEGAISNDSKRID